MIQTYGIKAWLAKHWPRVKHENQYPDDSGHENGHSNIQIYTIVSTVYYIGIST